MFPRSLPAAVSVLPSELPSASEGRPSRSHEPLRPSRFGPQSGSPQSPPLKADRSGTEIADYPIRPAASSGSI